MSNDSTKPGLVRDLALQELLDASVDGQCLWAPVEDEQGKLVDLRCTYVNPVAASIARRICGDMVGHTIRELAVETGRADLTEVLLTVAQSGAAKRRRLSFQTSDGPVWVDLSAVRVGNGLGLTGRNVTTEVRLQNELAAAHDELLRLAHTDPLTGLANRRAWNRELAAHFDGARHGGPLAVAIIDLDRFKAYNDRHGHQAGDDLLQQAAAAWVALIPPGATLARLGGEEFAAALPGVDLAAAQALIACICAATPGEQTASAGVTVWDGEEDAASLLGRADVALYAAKREGRDRVTAWAPLR